MDSALRFTDEQVAHVCHETNRALQDVLNDRSPDSPWYALPEWRKKSIVEGVRNARNGMLPRDLHNAWVKYYTELGWVYGSVKDYEKKTHPNLVSYEDLPPGERLKDVLFISTVVALTV